MCVGWGGRGGGVLCFCFLDQYVYYWCLSILYTVLFDNDKPGSWCTTSFIFIAVCINFEVLHVRTLEKINCVDNVFVSTANERPIAEKRPIANEDQMQKKYICLNC